MVKLSALWFFLVAMITASLLLCVQLFKEKPVIAQTSSQFHSSEQSTIIATASAPPKLVSAFLGGKPVYVLYVTQPEDTILVRCYPTYEPTLELRVMGNNSAPEAQKEGVMICRPSQ